MLTVVFCVVLRSIAMLRKWWHNKVAFNPITILPSRVLAKPYLIVYPVCLKHIGREWHIKVCEVASLVQCRLIILGILNCNIESLKDNERVALTLLV